MDYLTMLENKDLIDIGASYDYSTMTANFMFTKLFKQKKTSNWKIEYNQLVEGGNLPVMAQVHGLDTEARIGDRTNFETIKLEKLLIKEKLNQTERLKRFLREQGGTKDGIIDYVYADANNLVSRVLTRAEVANAELLSNGSITVNENNLSITVDYGFEDSHTVVLDGWSAAAADILGDLTKLKERARYNGTNIVRAITSSKIIGYMLANTAIKALWATKAEFLTRNRLISWLNELLGIEFITNDDTYKTSANASTTKRFYDVDSITFLSTTSTVGEGLWCETDEEMELTQGVSNPDMRVTVTQWKAPDPVAIWTKASGIYLPVMSNINSMYIGKVS